ncbi:MAG: hypothetical protein U1F76_11250 [Candidatus Competibacteraceae bacterium]
MKSVERGASALHEAGHEKPGMIAMTWMIAMNCQPTQAAMRDYLIGEVMRN